MPKPTIVGVPGAWHSAECFEDVRARFEAQGYSFVSRNAPSIQAEKALTATADEDAQFVRNEVLLPLLDDGKDVVVLMHSYGGVYGSAAVEGLSKTERLQKGEKGGVVALIYVSAVVPTVGKSCIEMMGTTVDALPSFVNYDVSSNLSALEGPRGDLLKNDQVRMICTDKITRNRPASSTLPGQRRSCITIWNPMKLRSGYQD